MPSTTTYKRGQVLVVNVPFSNHTGIKPRPALVITTDEFHRDLPDLVVCPISSQRRYYQRPWAGGLPASRVAVGRAQASEYGQNFQAFSGRQRNHKKDSGVLIPARPQSG